MHNNNIEMFLPFFVCLILYKPVHVVILAESTCSWFGCCLLVTSGPNSSLLYPRERLNSLALQRPLKQNFV